MLSVQEGTLTNPSLSSPSFAKSQSVYQRPLPSSCVRSACRHCYQACHLSAGEFSRKLPRVSLDQKSDIFLDRLGQTVAVDSVVVHVP